MSYSHLARRIAPVGLSVALVTSLGAGIATAAAPSYLSDPNFQALAAASTHTQAVTLMAANVEAITTSTGIYDQGTSSIASTTTVGTNRMTVNYGVKTVTTFSDNFLQPQASNAARQSNAEALMWDIGVPHADTLSKTRGIAASETPLPNKEYRYVDWFGYYPDWWGAFDKIDRPGLDPVQKKALRMLGVPDAQFVIGADYTDSVTGRIEYVQSQANAANPAYGLMNVMNLVTDEYIVLNGISAEVDTEGNMLYTLDTTGIEYPNDGLDIPWVFTVNPDGVVTKMSMSIDAGTGTSDFELSLLSWSIGAPTAAMPNPNSITVDARPYNETVDYLYAMDGLRLQARVLRDDINRSAQIAGVPVSPSVIQRGAQAYYIGFDYVVDNTKRGVVLSHARYYGDFECAIFPKKRNGTREAVVRCGQPSVAMEIMPLPERGK